jgi:hypothetical protein
VLDASPVVVVGSSTIVGPGRAVEVLVDLPMTTPRSDFEPEQAPVTRATATAMPATPAFLKAGGVRMGEVADLSRRVELLDFAYTSARPQRRGRPEPRLRPIRLAYGPFLPATGDR